MSVNCPYDDTFCTHKAQELADFQQRVHRLAKDKVNQVFIQASDDKCPIDPAECVRYQRYLNIVNKIKAQRTKSKNNGR